VAHVTALNGGGSEFENVVVDIEADDGHGGKLLSVGDGERGHAGTDVENPSARCGCARSA